MSERKRVLIITYHWPPMGGGGVQRWLKMVSYLREYNWEPVILTAGNADISLRDDSLSDEVPEGVETHRIPIWEPFSWYNRILGKKGSEKIHPGLLEESESRSPFKNMALWIRANIFIPDAKMFWIRPASAFLRTYLSSHKIDAIISSGPPHTTHLIARKAKKKFPKLPWIADFRDPWTNIDFYEHLNLTVWADRKHHRLEKKVLAAADRAVTVSWSWARDFRESTGYEVEVITNGYDSRDFEDVKGVSPSADFLITHVGSMNKDRNPHLLWKVLRDMSNEGHPICEKLEVRLIGPVDRAVFETAREYGLDGKIRHIKNIPHREVMRHLLSSWILLLPLNNTPNIDGVVPGKLFEYIGAGRPVLAIGKKTGDAARIIRETGAGKTVDFTEEGEMRRVLTGHYDNYLEGKWEMPQRRVEKYTRKNLAGQFARMLEKLTPN